jgi:type VI secretion system protein ImpK
MTDDNDRTVFKPTPGGDRGSARPTPGRRSGATEIGRTRPGAPAGGAIPAEPSSPPPLGGARSGFEQVRFNTALGLNPLVNAASTLIAVFEKIRHTARHPDVSGLHKRLVNEIRTFEQKAKDIDIKPEIVLAARYLLCCALDEAVLHTPWGDESAWGQRTLLSIYHGETFGGEKCFAILDRMLQAPAENLPMLELFYIFLGLGFEGKFRLIQRGRDQLDVLRDDLYRTIRNQRGDFERGLSPHWQGVGRTRKTLYHYVPMWVAASVFAALVFVGYAGFTYWMRATSDPVLQKLDAVIAQPALQ